MSWLTEAWRIFRLAERPLGARDVADRTGMSDNQAQKCICKLLAGGCLEFTGGSKRTGRWYRPVKGAAPPQQDMRGKSPAAREALARARLARSMAARPVSRFTDRVQRVPTGYVGARLAEIRAERRG